MSEADDTLKQCRPMAASPDSGSGYTLDSIMSPGFRFYQPEKGYRINVDTLILYDFARRHVTGRVLEIGSASGVTSILLSGIAGVEEVTGIETDGALYGASSKNVGLHACADRVKFVKGDINAYKSFFKPQAFHAIVTNPPFYKCGTGVASPQKGIDASHHDRTLALEALFRASRYLLRPGGALIMLFSTHRINDVFMNTKGFTIELLRFVHRTAVKPSDVFLMAARAGSGRQLTIVPPLIVHDGTGYSAEMAALLNGPISFT
ncbi:MAG: methyltransferase [Deltaproteobacteria bacterium]|nr:methyltransferase [Deltaproteobacteria bacterium]MCL5277859.1 methyltransferase [Deltaproteobacteria bacterium]